MNAPCQSDSVPKLSAVTLMPKPNPAVGIRSDAASTADTLLDTAEHLFATLGIDKVSMRRIAAECGHGNRSGALYHFGSREALIRALLERRMVVIDAIRNTRLDELAAAGRDRDLGAIIGCAVDVLADVVRQHAWGCDYVLVIAQALSSPRVQLLAKVDANSVSGFTRMTGLVRQVLPDLSAKKFDARMQMVVHETLSAFARWLDQHGKPTQRTRRSFNEMVNTVSEFMVAGLAAPG